MLFSFNDEFISAIAGGMDDGETTDLFASGIEAMIEEVEMHMQRTVGEGVEVKLVGDQLVVDLTQEQYDEEFGTPGVMLDPKFRTAFIQAAQGAKRAFSKAVSE
jgi:hypothetical protein